CLGPPVMEVGLRRGGRTAAAASATGDRRHQESAEATRADPRYATRHRHGAHPTSEPTASPQLVSVDEPTSLTSSGWRVADVRVARIRPPRQPFPNHERRELPGG